VDSDDRGGETPGHGSPACDDLGLRLGSRPPLSQDLSGRCRITVGGVNGICTAMARRQLPASAQALDAAPRSVSQRPICVHRREWHD
jgi:hypothetical protein